MDTHFMNIKEYKPTISDKSNEMHQSQCVTKLANSQFTMPEKIT